MISLGWIIRLRPNTVIEFYFSSTFEGEEHNIVVVDGSIPEGDGYLFPLYGYEDPITNHGIASLQVNTDYNNYTPSDAKRYAIPIGQYLTTGPTITLRFWNDDDDSVGSNSTFSNVRIYESTQLFTYNVDGSLAEAIDALGNVTAYTYPATNSNGLPVRITRPKGTVTTGDDDDYVTEFVYNAAGQITRERSYLESNKWVTQSYTYNAYGRGTMETSTDRYYTYDNGNPIGASGNVTNYTYDLLGRVIEKELPDPDGGESLHRPKTKYEYDAIGNLIEQTEVIFGEDDLVTEYEYDAMSRLVETENTDDTIVTTHYDSMGRVLATADELGRLTEYRYDERGRVIATILPDGNILRTAYDGGGRVIAKTDAEENTTHYRYDVLGRRTHVIDALCSDPTDSEPDHTVVTTHDAFGNVESVTDQLGNTTEYEYDVLNRLIKKVLPDPDNPAGTNRPTTYYEYDANGNLISQIDSQFNTSWADDPNIVAYWQLEDGAAGVANIADISCDDGVLVNNAVISQGALQLPGDSAAKIEVTDTDPLDIKGDADITISAWVYAESLNSIQWIIVAKRNDTDQQYGLAGR